MHELLLRAALQGQATFAASGDAGAYDLNRGCPPPFCDPALSVDYPASDSLITAAGGTTLPGLQEFCQNDDCTPPFFDINIPKERVWGWDYLAGLCSTVFGLDPISCGIFPAGSGGGVSIMFGVPLYQLFLPGVQRSQPGQSFTFEGTPIYALPSHFRGRNVPDVSFNADPETGYIILYTSDKDGFVEDIFIGGTSFVAPQLNGVSALLGEYLHGRRIGLLNFPLYALALTGQAYKGKHAPLHAITDGNNWFYQGSNGYNPGAGLGTLDVANFAKVLDRLF
jgi:subtilase family serine protease